MGGFEVIGRREFGWPELVGVREKGPTRALDRMARLALTQFCRHEYAW